MPEVPEEKRRRLGPHAVGMTAQAFATLARAEIKKVDPEWSGEGKKSEDLVAFEEGPVWAAFCEEYPADWEAVHKQMYKEFARTYCHEYKGD